MKAWAAADIGVGFRLIDTSTRASTVSCSVVPATIWWISRAGRSGENIAPPAQVEQCSLRPSILPVVHEIVFPDELASGTAPLNCLGEHGLDFIHWHTLALSLPAEGTLRRFPTEHARIERLVAVRWPEGIRCSRCGAAKPSRLLSRGTYQCRECRRQFSATSDSFLHRTRLDLGIWFRAAESMILYRARFSGKIIPGHALAEILGCEYVAARRVRKLVDADINRHGSGILSAAISVRSVELPSGLQPNTEAHILWLLAQKTPSEPRRS